MSTQACSPGQLLNKITGDEEAKRLERRKCARHLATIAALTADVKNDRWQSSQERRII
jgi:cell division septum initiation protein DivIVA